MRDRAAIAGIGYTEFSKDSGVSTLTLGLRAVTAALDDANIGRINEIVKELAATSQFVLITHNKHTIEIADLLYGVTMERKGVSKLVSVEVH